MVIAKQASDAVRSNLHIARLVEAVGVGGSAVGVAEKADVERTAENSFIRAEPLKAFFRGNCQRLVGDGAFRRPQTGGLHAKNSLMIFAGKPQLFAGIFGMAVGASGERRPRVGDARDIGIAKSRKSGGTETTWSVRNQSTLRP